jgi:uncharacterized protein (TIGR00106 family)
MAGRARPADGRGGTGGQNHIKESATMVLLEFSMSPLGKGESVGKYVARSLDIIDKSGVDYRLNPMGTVLEGEWDEVFGVVKKCYERMRKDCGRISCTIKVDYRKAAKGRLSSKVASIEKQLKRRVKQ